MKKLLIVAFLAIICSACTDYVAWTDIEYKNNSSYDIHFLSASILSNPDMQNIIKTEKNYSDITKRFLLYIQYIWHES